MTCNKRGARKRRGVVVMSEVPEPVRRLIAVSDRRLNRRFTASVGPSWLLSVALAAGVVFFACPPAAEANPQVGRADVEDLRESMDSGLQRLLERRLQALGLDRDAADGRLAVTLVDVTDPAQPHLAQVNGDRMLYAASLPKIAILLAAFQKASEGKLKLDAAAMDELKQMIRHSSNSAASDMLRRVGPAYVAQVLQSSRYRLYDPARNGGLWVGKPYASGVAFRRDPLHHISHGATAYQVARFYYLLETGRLVSPQASRQMKKILGEPAIHHKFVAGLERVHPDALIYRKSGTWRTYHCDSAIVERDGRRYIAVALANDPNGGAWMRELIVAMDEIVFSRPLPPMKLQVSGGPVLGE